MLATRTKTKRPPLEKPPSLEFAQIIAHRRACRVAENRQVEENNNHFWNMKNSIELENAFQEKQRMESHLRLGNVPAHISHPIAAAMMAPQPMEVDAILAPFDGPAPIDMEVDAGGRVAGRLSLNHANVQYPTGERKIDRERGIPNLEDYDPEEYAIAHLRGTPKPPKMINPDALKRYNIKVRARNAQYSAKNARP